MPVATDKVTDRRLLHFTSFAELAEEVDRIVRAQEAGTLRTSGNWSAGQILQHLGKTVQFSLDGFPFRAPLPVRLIFGSLKRVMWKRLLNMAFKPGFQLPPRAGAILPADTVPVGDGAAFFLAQLGRVQKGEQMTRPSPFMGALTHEQWTELHLRHADSHLSFIHYEKP